MYPNICDPGVHQFCVHQNQDLRLYSVGSLREKPKNTIY